MRTIGALIFPGFELLDLFGPMEMFGFLGDDYELHLIAEREGAVESGHKLSAMASLSIHEHCAFDILFVPGGKGTRREVENQALLDCCYKQKCRIRSQCVHRQRFACQGWVARRQACNNQQGSLLLG